jgi:hypothetical protein
MKQLAALTAAALALVLVALYLGDSSGSSPPANTGSPTPVPEVRSEQEAIDDASPGAADFGYNPYEVTAEHMLAGEAAAIVRDMGIGELPVIPPTVLPTCPPDSFGCGFASAIADDAPGYLVLFTGVPDPSALPESSPGARAVSATWVGDGDGVRGIGFAYPSATPEANGSLLIERADWSLTSPPSGDTLSLIVAVGGSCEKFDRIATSETADVVTIHAYIQKTFPPPNLFCTAEMITRNVTVQLNAPLGDRKLVGCDAGLAYPYFESTRPPVNCLTVRP